MRRWTNDRWMSTLHRVIVTQGDFSSVESSSIDELEQETRLKCRRRQSIAFFHNVNRDALITVLLAEEGEASKHKPIFAGEFVL